MTDKDTLPVAQHYYEIGKYQQAYDHLTAMNLNVGRQDQVDHHLLLVEILDDLDRTEEAQALIDELLSRFPDNDDCMVQWIIQARNDYQRVEEAYALARSMRIKDPDDYWYPLMMARMAFYFRLQPKTTVQGLVEQALGIERNEQTLLAACQIIGHYHKPIKIKRYLDELVEIAPEAESTYLTLLEFLLQSRRYMELGQVSYEAIKKFPKNEKMANHLETATNHLYGGYLGRLFNWSSSMAGKLGIRRSSTRAWLRLLKEASHYFSALIEVLLIIIGSGLGGLAIMFFFHYFIFTVDERSIRKQRERRRKKHEFEFADQLTDLNGATSALVTSTHLKYRFIFLSPEQIVLAKDVWCPVENMHFNLDTEDLQEPTSIAHQDIKSITVTDRYLVINTRGWKKYNFYFESIESFEFLIRQLEKYRYRLTKTHRSSRFWLIVFCCLGAKGGLVLSLMVFFLSWKIGLFMALAVLTNLLSLFVYRIIFPLKTDIYQFQLGHS